MSQYAERTSVPVGRSKDEIEHTLEKYGATRFAYMSEPHAAMIAFEVEGRAVRFTLPMPARAVVETTKAGRVRGQAAFDNAYDAAVRQRWRAFALCIKAKLEAVECGITSFEEEFLAHFVVKGGQTLGQLVIPKLEEVAKGGSLQNLLGYSR